MNQWTMPDAYAGDVHDPMSQKPYMWNGNNPITYADPSGYDIHDQANNVLDHVLDSLDTLVRKSSDAASDAGHAPATAATIAILVATSNLTDVKSER